MSSFSVFRSRLQQTCHSSVTLPQFLKMYRSQTQSCSLIFVQVRKMAAMSEAEFEMQKSRLLDKANQAKNRPYGYYEVLELSQKAKVKDIKRAYFQKARIYHPDAFPMTDTDGVYRAEIARLKFDEITEAYQTLMDIDQRCFYDKHGYPSETLRQKELPDIFDWSPKFGIYEEEMLADEETTHVEEWMAAQGHSTKEQNITFKQRLKNAYIEYKYGMAYYNFPWNPKLMAGWVLTIVAICVITRMTFVWFISRRMDSLPTNSSLRPRLWNDRFGDDDPRDLLSHLGIRKKYQSEVSRAGLYHRDPTSTAPATPIRERDPNAKFSDEMFKTMHEITSYSANKDRHDQYKFEQKLLRLEFLLSRKVYLDAQVIKANDALAGKSATAEPKRPTGLAPHKILQFDTTIPTNEFVEMPSDRIRFELGEVNKQLSAVEKELEAIANAGESGEKLALPAKFS